MRFTRLALKIRNSGIRAALARAEMGITDSELRAERTNLASQLKPVDGALAVLGKLDGGSSYTEPRRTLSAAARRKINLAQKARWANRLLLPEQSQ
jgi:hypothetical protein